MPGFPFSRSGLYPIEGVIGAVEVKSTLTAKGLSDALSNAKSVVDLSAHMAPGGFHERIKEIAGREKVTCEEAKRRAMWEIIPATYVFSYMAMMKPEALSNGIDKWFRANEKPVVADGQCPVLPRLIVAGEAIGIQDDGYFVIDPGADVLETMRAEHGPNVRVLMGCWDTHRPFGMLACHLLNTVCNRIGLGHGTSGVRYDVKQHLPVATYAEDEFNNRLAKYVAWPR